jgi:hypothetical protein
VCFLINATLVTESKLYRLSCLSLPIHTSAKAIQAGGRVNLDGYIMLSVSYVHQILIKTEICRQILVKHLNIKFLGNLISLSRVSEGQTDGRSDFNNVP